MFSRAQLMLDTARPGMPVVTLIEAGWPVLTIGQPISPVVPWPGGGADVLVGRSEQVEERADPLSSLGGMPEQAVVVDGFEVASGVPVVTAPEEIDITNAPALRSALLEAAAHGHGTLVVDMTPDPVLRFVRASHPAGGAQARPG